MTKVNCVIKNSLKEAFFTVTSVEMVDGQDPKTFVTQLFGRMANSGEISLYLASGRFSYADIVKEDGALIAENVSRGQAYVWGRGLQ